MNYPNALPFAVLGIVFIISLAGCPDTEPAKDDTAEPADGGTAGALTCEAELERVKAELAECQAPK